MLNTLFKLALAALIAAGIVGYVTGGDLGQVSEAVDKAARQTAERKAENIAARDNPAAEPPRQREVEVVTQSSAAEPLNADLTLTGATEANRQVTVNAEISGKVARAPAQGTRVQRGDLLCQLEVGDRAVRRESAVARFKQAQVDARAQKSLSDRGFAAANRSSDAATNAAVIRAEIKQLDVEIARLEIRAPFDGVVEEDPAEIGALLQPGGMCAMLIDPDPLRVVATVPEFQIGKVEMGAEASARLVTGQNVEGRVAFIAQMADPATRTFRVEIEVPNPDYRLRDGVTAQVTIPLPAELGHELPQSALTLDEEGRIGVMIDSDGTARFRPVDILRNDTEGVWVSGLGDRADVIVVGQEYVRDGIPVKATPQKGDILGSES